MKFIMRERLWSMGGRYDIREESGEDAYYVKGKVFSIGDKLSFCDLDERELAYIEQKIFNWGPTYEIHSGGQRLAVVKKKLFTIFKCRFDVDVPGPNDLEAEGDFLHHEYAFTRNGRTVASVSKRWFSWTDTYGIDIGEEEDPVLLLASAVVIDLACHRKH
ncbi:MAG: hypothetical protein ACI8X5_003678 [Planctomycetota bacterium]|jgi:uncharacterized protein YxjI